jgi:hypothetical protein
MRVFVPCRLGSRRYGRLGHLRYGGQVAQPPATGWQAFGLLSGLNGAGLRIVARLESEVVLALRGAATPLGLTTICVGYPGVGRRASGQPRALGRNPVGILRACLNLKTAVTITKYPRKRHERGRTCGGKSSPPLGGWKETCKPFFVRVFRVFRGCNRLFQTQTKRVVQPEAGPPGANVQAAWISRGSRGRRR